MQTSSDLGEGVPSASVVALKLCCICGADVTERKREKDRLGRYWCEPCGDAETRNKAAIARQQPIEPCLDCGRLESPSALIIDANKEHVCRDCHQIRAA